MSGPKAGLIRRDSRRWGRGHPPQSIPGVMVAAFALGHAHIVIARPDWSPTTSRRRAVSEHLRLTIFLLTGNLA
jgi:hypothetical protein